MSRLCLCGQIQGTRQPRRHNRRLIGNQAALNVPSTNGGLARRVGFRGGWKATHLGAPQTISLILTNASLPTDPNGIYEWKGYKLRASLHCYIKWTSMKNKK